MTEDNSTFTSAFLIIGAGGLLGQALLSQIPKRSRAVAVRASNIPWQDSSGTRKALTLHLRKFLTTCGDAKLHIYWVAGASTLRSARDSVLADESSFGIFLEAASDCLRETATNSQKLKLFFASSAGGVYSKSQNPPFTETSSVAPSSFYGESKLRMEAVIADWAIRNQVQCLIGRISSIYGEKQKTNKQQGFLSALIRNTVKRQPTTIFAPLGSIRNYVYASDAANLILRHSYQQDETVRVANICAPYNSTLASVIQSARSITKMPVLTQFTTPPHGVLDAQDLRVNTHYIKWVNEECRTPLSVGMNTLFTAELLRLRN